MEGVLVVLALALAVGAVGLGIGMLVAPRLSRWAERDDEDEGPQE